MPTLQGKNGARFNSLKLQTLAAIRKVRQKRKETSDFDEQKALRAHRKELQALLFQLDDAQDDFARTAMSVAQAERELKDAASTAKKAVDKMKNVAETLAKAEKLVKTLTRFVTLF